jgi:hypothetical protein
VTDTVLILAWLVLAHLLADFVLQNDWIAINKATGGRQGWAALSVHGFHVGLCLVPAVIAYGVSGLAYLLVVVLSHMAVDRWKVRATRRSERASLEAARRRHAGKPDSTPSGLGVAWTPWPGMLFAADQALHLTVALVGWLVLLQAQVLQTVWLDVVNRILGSWDRASVHAVVLTGVVLVSLFLVNTRAAYYVVLALVSPREIPETSKNPADVAPAEPPPPEPAAVPQPVAAFAAAVASGVGRVSSIDPSAAPLSAAATANAGAANGNGAPTNGSGPMSPEGGGIAVMTAEARPGTVVAGQPAPTALPSGAPARIGATIGAFERLLIVALILVNATAAVGFVIAAKTIARFKQLDDRGFAEYYLLGTLASVSVAIGSAIVAQAALNTIP